MDAADDTPAGMTVVKKRLERLARRGELGAERSVERTPLGGEHFRRQILAAGHWRRRGGQRRQDFRRRQRDRLAGGRAASVRPAAGCGDKARGQVAPVRERGRQGRLDFLGPQLEQPVPVALCERLAEPGAHLRRDGHRRLVVRDQQMAVGRELKRQRHPYPVPPRRLSGSKRDRQR